jgi:hypothetical protein
MRIALIFFYSVATTCNAFFEICNDDMSIHMFYLQNTNKVKTDFGFEICNRSCMTNSLSMSVKCIPSFIWSWKWIFIIFISSKFRTWENCACNFFHAQSLNMKTNETFTVILCGQKTETINWECICQSQFMADSQSVSQYVLVSSPLCGRLTRYCFLFKSSGLEFVVLSLWGVLSDERPGLPFVKVYHFMADSQSVSQYVLVSSPLCGCLTRYCFLFKCLGLEFVVLSLWGALSDERLGLSFVSHSVVISLSVHLLLTFLCFTLLSHIYRVFHDFRS